MRYICSSLLLTLFVHLGFGAEFVCQSSRQIPVVREVDLVVVGGSMGAVAAAAEAAAEGVSVLLVGSLAYLGEDLCATMRLWLDEGESQSGELTSRIFAGERVTTPMRVKQTLEAALLEAGADFLLCCYPTDVLVDGNGDPAGIVIANRAGRQAIMSKVIVDATQHAVVAKLAGARFRACASGKHSCERIVLGGNTTPGEVPARRISAGTKFRGDELPYYEYSLDLDLGDGSFAALAQAEQRARDLTYRDGQLRSSERLSFVPLDSIIGETPSAGIPTGSLPPLEHFQPQGRRRLYVLSGLADLPRDRVRAALRPDKFEAIGRLVGKAAAQQSRKTGVPVNVVVKTDSVPAAGDGDVREVLRGLRPTDRRTKTISSSSSGVPVLAEADVVVIGGGTSGACAAIGAARRGADVLVVEYQEGLGGVGTMGLIGRPYHGQKRGFTKEVPFCDEEHNTEYKMEWFRRAIRDAGGRIWLRVLGCGASYVNTDYLLVDESDIVDVWRAFVGVRMAGSPTSYDIGAFIQNRERRRVVGDHVLSYLDQIAGRTYPDSIVLSGSDYDSHGYPSEPYFALIPHTEKTLKANHPAPGGTCYTPYRCLLPRGLEGILVTGLGMSMHRDATAMVRMQLDMQNQGYAAGVAAAMAAEKGCTPRQIDVKTLQRHLVEIGNLPEEVLRHEDSFPLPDSVVLAAVREYGDPTLTRATRCKALAIILSHTDKARPALKLSFASATGEPGIAYAKLLGFMGEREVVPTLIERLEEIDQWDAKIFQGSMAEYAHLPTPVDALILALGGTRDRRALPVLLQKLDTLDRDVILSHHRSLAIALEQIGDPAAAELLANLLNKPGMRGHVMRGLEPIANQPQEKRRRLEPLREIVLARALYRCGDWKGLGRQILDDYRQDIRGLFARHAGAVLSGGDH